MLEVLLFWLWPQPERPCESRQPADALRYNLTPVQDEPRSKGLRMDGHGVTDKCEGRRDAGPRSNASVEPQPGRID